MNINWKVRVKNVSFWVSVAIALITPVLAYFGLTVQDMTSWCAICEVIVQAVKNPYVLLMAAVSVYNAVVDPTSTGVTDSARALTYTEPNADKGAVK